MEDRLYLDLGKKDGCNKIKFGILYGDKVYYLSVSCVDVDGITESCSIFENSFRLKLNTVGRKSKGGYKTACTMVKENYKEIKENYISLFGDIEFDEEELMAWLNEKTA